MVLKEVDAVWVWQFGLSAQKATYGRFTDNPRDRSFTKDYLQTSGPNASLLSAKFPPSAGTGRSTFNYQWPGGSTPGFTVWSNDRLHLSWTTGLRGPAPWRLTPDPTEAGPGTFPGDPNATKQADAYTALRAFTARRISGVLVGVKLVGEDDVLHARAYIINPPPSLAFAATSLMPPTVEALTTGFTKRKACQSADFTTAGASPVYFDADRNHDAWSTSPPAPPTARIAPLTTMNGTNASYASLGPDLGTDDSFAEAAPFSQTVVDQILKKIDSGDFSVRDNYSTIRTRGSAQRAFAKVVKDNYGWKCAITGIATREFLVASHIVPWADDASIRTDPANGICLSTLVDKAFDAGYLTIGTDLIVHVNGAKLMNDPALLAQLAPHDGVTLATPLVAPPDAGYLQRRLDKTP
ncbi:HNH endonuclease signature motif containing protein [Microbacterium sp. KSW4-17]|uniref:HNH endonuclease signature motif containing protein n=1 Tax=Microbacterium galbum TaxID=3075994 RepID=A0ABU3T8C7_9MICO|nr:HNH endonuclease signature motif containing protein [Microbacterium sp. KSW4-17]MDU0367623.1 HNH endonuclease signature motif containing protein [Microbacterium sp. KSW4-17]